MKNLGYFFVAVALVGCGDSTTPTASGVFPAEGFTGRSLRVEISGDATTWKDGATVSFGDGVTVKTVEVASQTDVFADIEVDAAAALGPRDVAVTSGGTFTLKQAFVLKSPLDIQFTGAVAQGSLPQFKIINHDFDNPFDATQGSDPNTGATTYPNLVITGPAGVDFMSPLLSGSLTVSAYEVSGFATVDVDAESGPVTIESGAQASAVSSQSDKVTVATRTATALTAGAAGTGMIPNVNDTALFSLPAGGTPELARFVAASDDQAAQPIVAMLGSSGHWADFLGAGAAPYMVMPTGDTVYAIVFDGGTEAGYSVSVTGHNDMLAVVNEPTTTHNTVATAVPATAVPFMMNTASMNGTATTDADFVKFVIPASSPLIGKVFHVTTMLSPDTLTDVAIDVLQGGTTSITADGQPQDADGFMCGFFGQCGVEFVTKPIPAAGTYAFKLTAGASYTTDDKAYNLIFWVE